LQYLRLERLGCNDRVAHQFEEHIRAGLVPARVTVQHRGAWMVATEEGDDLAAITGRLRHEAPPGELPVVGDWVALRDGLIDVVLPRSSKFSRKTAWTEVAEQVLVANVDIAFLVMGLDDRDFNLRRLERYLTTAWEGGATPVIVLNKADLAADLDRQVAETESVAFGVPIHAVSAETGEGIDGLGQYLAGGRTAALLGSSGVGKSSIINRLLADEHFRTNAVRSDGRGRHTTTHRELVAVPGGGVIVDTPGLRELQLWEADGGLDQAFADIADLVARCRFSDCEHRTEPGCAVKAALADGALRADRWESYLKLQRELEHLERKLDPRLRSASRKRWAAITKAHRQRRKIVGH
jgi:ribosome biogenesis GTPase / thiamine phosphate phosphatase